MHKDLLLCKAEEIKDDLISLRRDLHSHPEAGLKELRTSELIAKTLISLGIEVKREVGITGVVGVLKGKNPGKTIALRADMDCLNIEEKTNLDFKSKYPGYMHACGHDAHMAIVIGAAMILSKLKDDINGNIKFIFQPAEEVIGGAERMIKAGVLENPKVDAIIGGHVWPSIPSGKFGVKYGAMMASPDTFELKILGKGGHGAQPENCIDPIAVACEVYMGLQSIVSRKISATDSVVLTVGKFTAGDAPNIIPQEVIMEGTTRTFDPEFRKNLPIMMEKIIKGITEAHDAQYEFNYVFRYPPVINDSSMADLSRQSITNILGEENTIIMDKPEMIGEDFSFFQNKVPGIFLALGTLNEEKHIKEPLHSPFFNIDEDILPIAAAVFSKIALDFLNNNIS